MNCFQFLRERWTKQQHQSLSPLRPKITWSRVELNYIHFTENQPFGVGVFFTSAFHFYDAAQKKESIDTNLLTKDHLISIEHNIMNS
jgi:hypothetical protein